MNDALSHDLQWSAAHWLLRLPMLGARELASLLDTEEHIATSTLLRLNALGWTDWIVAQSPELESERVFYLTEHAFGALAMELGMTVEQLSQGYATGRREMLLRVLRVETAVGLNEMLAGLSAGLDGDNELNLYDQRSLPWAARRARWWPREVEAYGCLRSGGWYAPFFIAWDRAGAPAAHRRARVAGLYSFRDAPTSPWGPAPPPILVVCPTVAEAEQWARIVSNSADRRGCDPLTLSLTTLSSITKKSALGPIWRRIDGTLGLPLAERLRWTMRLPSCLENVRERLSGPTALLPLREPAGPRLAGSAIALPLTQKTKGNVTERLARAAATMSGVQKEMLEWVGHHPYLSSNDLSVLLKLGKEVVEKHLFNLEKPALVSSVVRRVERETFAQPRYFLTEDALKLLAARDGVPPQRYARRGVLAAEGDGGSKGGMRLAGLLRYFEHTVGANSFFVRLAAEAQEPRRRRTHRFVAWLSPAEGQEWFRWRDRLWHIWPDGRAVYEVDGRRFDVLLEWERGRTRRRDLMEKFLNYSAWLESRTAAIGQRVKLVIVTVSPSMENKLLAIARDTAKVSASLSTVNFVTTQSRWAGDGALGSCWRQSAGDLTRVSWWQDSARL